MPSLEMSIIWCALQVTLIATFAFGVARYSAGNALLNARLLNITSIVMLGLTVAVFFPNFECAKEVNQISAISQNSVAADHSTRQTADSPPLVQVYSETLIRLFSKFQAGGQSVSQSVVRFPQVSFIVVGIMVAASSLGLLRLVYSWFFLRRVVSRSRPIRDPSIVKELDEILARMNRSNRMNRLSTARLRESSDVDSAALISCRRPCIVLPMDWRTWTADERRIVFAHEAAHLAHRDGFWRIIQMLASALHAYNPFIQWLFRRGVLFQEIAADRQATITLGINVEEYLQALAKLAVRQDDRFRSGRRYGSHLLAVQSEFLLRRIKMLRTMEGCHRHSRSPQTNRVVSLAWTMLLVVISLTTFVLRGTAQEPDVEEVRVASFESTTTSKSPMPPKSNRLFGRAAFPTKNDIVNEDGQFILRFSELKNVPGSKSLIALAKSQFAAEWKLANPEVPVPQIDLSQLDYVTGHASMTIARSDREEDEEHPNSLSLGAQHVKFHFNSPVDLIAMIKAFVPEAVVEKGESDTGYKIQVPSFSPNPIYFDLQDPYTIGMNTVKSATAQDPSSEKSTKSAWRSAWERQDGGLFTFTVATKNADKIVVGANPDAQAAQSFMLNTETYTVAADADADGKITLRIVMGCVSATAAKIVSESLSEHFAAESSTESDLPNDHPVRELMAIKPTMIERPDGRVDVTVEYATNRTIPELIKSLF